MTINFQPLAPSLNDVSPVRARLNAVVPSVGSFPPRLFEEQQVSIADLRRLNIPVEETIYLAVGGGLGSFAWVDHLLIYGISAANVVSIGFEARPHGRYQRLCHNSQIPDHERLRSDSGSTPDNIWGWPGYAVREIGQNLAQRNLRHAANLAWQIFTEPVFSEPYTPKASQVYAAIEREAQRIGWNDIWRFGRVRSIRKTDDGRYAVAYSQSSTRSRVHKIMVAQHLHLALGYPGLRFLPDLQAYREQTLDFKHVVNAYENHHHIYDHLRRNGGTVLIRGRGIVASRIIQRLHETRSCNPNIGILHLMRSPRPNGSRYQHSHRIVEHHFELQPYNFPKSCFGGDLRALLEQVDELERPQLLELWGGTTTANRSDWREIIETGLNEGWYQIRFGAVEAVKRGSDGKLSTTILGRSASQEKIHLQADFIIDATGLDATLKNNPLLDDLTKIYQLEKNALGRLRVSADFELPAMRNKGGRTYASGAMTLGGPFGPVDSFVGLQFAAQRAANSLARHRAPRLRPFSAVRSASQWLRWAVGVQP